MHRHSKYQSTTTEYRLEEHHLYGSSRLGMEQYVDDTLYYGQTFSLLGNSTTTVTPLTPSNDFAETQAVGAKQFEFTDHRGNVNVVVSDRKLSVEDGSTGNTDYYTADVISYADYYPFGMQMPDRNGSTDAYRYGFNGMEKDDEVSGSGNSYTTEFRQYDSRLGRWLSVDPMAREAAGWTPYRAFFNNPITYTDPQGLFEDNYTVDKSGNIELVEETDDEFDMLYTEEDYNNGDLSNGRKFSKTEEGTSILSDIASNRFNTAPSPGGSYSNSHRYAVSTNRNETFDLFKFVVDNSDTEWLLHGFDDPNTEERSYVIGTSHHSNSVNAEAIRKRAGFALVHKAFDIHSQPTNKEPSPRSNVSSYNADQGNWYMLFDQMGRDQSKMPPFYIYHKPTKQMWSYRWEIEGGRDRLIHTYMRTIYTVNHFFINWGAF